MKLVKSAIVKAFSASKKPGIVSVKRFSRTKVRVRRFSQDGSVEFDEVVEDEDIANEGSDTAIVDQVPAENVAVFSDEDTAVDEVIAEVDGGDATPVIEARESDGFVADTEEDTPDAEVEEEAVAEECGDDDTAAVLAQASKRC